jgi:hypothetical protein
LKKIKKDQEEDECELDPVKFPYVCKIEGCGRRFSATHQLGGHTSKAHPNMSVDFARKSEKRAQREPDRLLLLKAKEIFEKMP